MFEIRDLTIERAAFLNLLRRRLPYDTSSHMLLVLIAAAGLSTERSMAFLERQK